MVVLPREINPLDFHSAEYEGAEHGTSEVPPLTRHHTKWLAYTQIFMFWVRFPSVSE